jgi:hypothetical protein
MKRVFSGRIVKEDGSRSQRLHSAKEFVNDFLGHVWKQWR